MKKHFYLFSALFAGLFVTSCGNEDFVVESVAEESGTPTEVTVTASMPNTDTSTKVELTPTDTKVEVKWKDSGEKFSVLKGQGSVKPNTFTETQMDAAASSANFTGKIYKDNSATYYAIYPMLASSSAAKATEIPVNLATQNGELNPDNIYMYASSQLSSDKLTFNFEHLTSIMSITLTIPETVAANANTPEGTSGTEAAATTTTDTPLSLTKVTLSAKGLRTNATADIVTGTISPETYTDAGEIVVEGNFSTGTPVYFHVMPGTITELSVKAEDASGNIYWVTNLPEELELTKGTVHVKNAEIEQVAEVATPDALSAALENKSISTIVLTGDVESEAELWITRDLTVYLGTNTLTIPNSDYANEINAVLTIIGGDISQEASDKNRGKIVDSCEGFSVYGEGAKLIMKNVDYETGWTTEINASDQDVQAGVTLAEQTANQTVEIDNCSFKCVHYCVTTNALEPTQPGNVIKLSNSTFTCDETPLLCNINATVTAENCIFNGGSQAAFIRAGSATFDKCAFNLSKSDSYSYEVMYVGDSGSNTWRSGQEAPFAALLIGNRYGDANAYKYKKDVTLTNGCTFSVTGFTSLTDGQSVPAVYIDTMEQDEQKVTFTYDSTSKSNIDANGGLTINSSRTSYVTETQQ